MPESSTCVPNTSKIQILAPIGNPDICPLWSERWELRTRPLGCHISTITFLTCIVSVLSTFVVILLIWGGLSWVDKPEKAGRLGQAVGGNGSIITQDSRTLEESRSNKDGGEDRDLDLWISEMLRLRGRYSATAGKHLVASFVSTYVGLNSLCL